MLSVRKHAKIGHPVSDQGWYSNDMEANRFIQVKAAWNRGKPVISNFFAEPMVNLLVWGLIRRWSILNRFLFSNGRAHAPLD